MTTCAQLSSHNTTLLLVTKSNYYDVIPDNFNRTPGTQVTVSCLDDLRLVGKATFSCQNDGTWSYGAEKPYCTSVPTTTPSSLDEDTKIMIGVVCGVAALIIIVLVLLIVAVWYRDRRRNKDKRRLHDAVYRGSHYDDYKSRSRGGVSTVDNMEMYGSRGGPPPYASNYSRDYSFTDRKPKHVEYDRGDRSRDRDYDKDYERDSRFGNRMYLPKKSDNYRDYYNDIKKNRKSKRERYDDINSDPGKAPYVSDWIRRSSMNRADSEDYLDRAYVHGRGGERDSYMWRNA